VRSRNRWIGPGASCRPSGAPHRWQRSREANRRSSLRESAAAASGSQRRTVNLSQPDTRSESKARGGCGRAWRTELCPHERLQPGRARTRPRSPRVRLRRRKQLVREIALPRSLRENQGRLRPGHSLFAAGVEPECRARPLTQPSTPRRKLCSRIVVRRTCSATGTQRARRSMSPLGSAERIARQSKSTRRRSTRVERRIAVGANR
jgi:hypothetical protein